MPAVILAPPQSILSTAAKVSLSYQTLLTPRQQLHSTLDGNQSNVLTMALRLCMYGPCDFSNFMPSSSSCLDSDRATLPGLLFLTLQYTHQAQGLCTCCSFRLEYWSSKQLQDSCPSLHVCFSSNVTSSEKSIGPLCLKRHLFSQTLSSYPVSFIFLALRLY